MTSRNKSGDVLVEYNGCTFVYDFSDFSSVLGAHAKFFFVFIPRIILRLLMSNAQFAPFYIQFQNNYFHLVANAANFGWMLDFFGPRQIRNINQPVDSFFQFHKNTKVGKVAYGSGMT